MVCSAFLCRRFRDTECSLADNIDMSALAAYSWTPLGYYNVETQTGKSYDGVFDGNGYSNQ